MNRWMDDRELDGRARWREESVIDMEDLGVHREVGRV